MHVWIDEHRAITLRDKHHTLSALRDIRIALQAGRGPRKPGGLLVQLCEKIVRDVAPSIDEMDDEVEKLEDAVSGRASTELRRSLADIRRRAVHLRRYLGPEREALIRLQTEDTRLLDKQNRLRLRCVIDSVTSATSRTSTRCATVRPSCMRIWRRTSPRRSPSPPTG